MNHFKTIIESFNDLWLFGDPACAKASGKGTGEPVSGDGLMPFGMRSRRRRLWSCGLKVRAKDVRRAPEILLEAKEVLQQLLLRWVPLPTRFLLLLLVWQLHAQETPTWMRSHLWRLTARELRAPSKVTINGRLRKLNSMQNICRNRKHCNRRSQRLRLEFPALHSKPPGAC